MEHTILINKLAAYGADIEGIDERFMGKTSFYEQCFQSFINEVNFRLLSQWIEDGNYEQAEFSAHTLKGLAGNLGLTPLYKSISKLVESLKMKEYGGVRQEYGEIKTQIDQLKAFMQEE